MKRVLLLGATGMLGSAVYGVLKDKYQMVLAVRDVKKIDLLEKAYGGTAAHQIIEFDAERVYQNYLDKKGFKGESITNFVNQVGNVDYVINAIGVTIPFSMENPALTFFINSALPHILANIYNSKVIHITTDCVYNGQEGFPYDERAPRTPIDIYGLSKSLGEPTNCLTIRTSIIGRELEGFTGMLEWFLKQQGNTIKGYANHFWNGITTKQFGKICDEIMTNPTDYPQTGLYHVFSNVVSKYDMLMKFKEKYNIDCKIDKDDEPKLNRTMGTVYDFNSKLDIPLFDEMLNEL